MEVLFPVKDDRLGLHFAVLNVDLVAGENNWNIFANSNQITMPVWNVFVCYTRCDVKHDDSTFACENCKRAKVSGRFTSTKRVKGDI